jgi:hypothetical protein
MKANRLIASTLVVAGLMLGSAAQAQGLGGHLGGAFGGGAGGGAAGFGGMGGASGFANASRIHNPTDSAGSPEPTASSLATRI